MADLYNGFRVGLNFYTIEELEKFSDIFVRTIKENMARSHDTDL